MMDPSAASEPNCSTETPTPEATAAATTATPGCRPVPPPKGRTGGAPVPPPKRRPSPTPPARPLPRVTPEEQVQPAPEPEKEEPPAPVPEKEPEPQGREDEAATGTQGEAEGHAEVGGSEETGAAEGEVTGEGEASAPAQTGVGCMPPQITEEFRRVFKFFDSDSSGAISPSELQEVLSRQGNEVTMEEATLLLKEADQDGNGEIDFNEFVAFMYNYLISHGSASQISALRHRALPTPGKKPDTKE
ncbi:hypothetical protein Pelo_5562 [Pelomyxa schiedti]|nr:hypothetical protein Pelo_5562 [Pelomyxa schiedti]